jgi:hypothetical protein
VNGGALAAVVGAGPLPAVVGILPVFGGMLGLVVLGSRERKDEMVNVNW